MDIFLWIAGKSGVDAGLFCFVCGADGAGAGGEVKGGARVTRFLPAEIAGGWDGVEVRVVGWQGSGDVVANARGNGYVVLPAGVEHFPAGLTVRVLLR